MVAPRFSIITVTYNAGQLLERTIESVLAQTSFNYEYIILDGQSKDNTLEIIKKYEHHINKWISEPDNGIYDAMNKAIDIARGEYILFLNAGDTFHSESVLRTLEISTESRPDVIYGETAIVDSENNHVAMRRLKAPQTLTWRSFINGMLVCHQSFLIKREIATHYDLDYKLSADFDWCIRGLKSAKSITNSNITISNFMQGGVSTSRRKLSLKERFDIMTKHYGAIPTYLMHIWFAIRFAWAKYVIRQID
ncbi:MAG: glycosyltransferase family 2 protein [Bacteroidales bacterium]